MNIQNLEISRNPSDYPSIDLMIPENDNLSIFSKSQRIIWDEIISHNWENDPKSISEIMDFIKIYLGKNSKI